MLLESLSNVACGLVGIDIPVFLAERQTTLAQAQDVTGDVLVVSAKIGAVGYSIAKLSVFQLHLLQGIKRLGTLHRVEQRFHGGYAFLVAARRVHSQLVEIADLTFIGAILILLLREICQDDIDLLVDILLKHVKTAIAAIGGRQGMGFLPATCGKLVEISCRTHGLIEVRQDESRLVLSLNTTDRSCGKQERR